MAAKTKLRQGRMQQMTQHIMLSKDSTLSHTDQRDLFRSFVDLRYGQR